MWAWHVPLLSLAALHHEPWRDEADPWLFARDGDFANIVQWSRHAGTPTLWYWLLERGEAAVASAYLFMTPVFGVFFGWLLLHEHVTWPQLAGGALVAASIWLVNRTAVAPAPATAPAGATRSRRGSLASPRR